MVRQAKKQGGSEVSSSVPDELIEAMASVKATPDSDEAWDQVDEFARATQRPEDVSGLYREVLQKDLPRDVIAKVGERAVAFHEEWFEDPTHVIDILRRVLALDSNAHWAFERLSLLLTMAERWDDLLSEYDRALETAVDPEHKRKLLDEAARIAKDFAGQTNRGIDYLKQLVPLRPEDAQLASSLERRLVLQKRYPDLIDVWNARLGVMDAHEALATHIRIAETWLDRLSDAPKALEGVDNVIANGGTEDACRLLEKIGVRQEAPRETRRAALLKLHDLFVERERPEDVVRSIELALDVADGPGELARLRMEARDRLADLGRNPEAVDHGAELLVLMPEEEVRNRLRELVALTGRHDRFVDALVRASAVVEDGAVRVDFLVEAGHVCQDALSDATRAISLYSQVLADAASGDAAQLDVCRRLTQLLVEPEHARQRLEVLERLADLEPEVEERRRVLGEAGRLAEQLGDDEHALGLWRRRLEKHENDHEALDASVVILERLERWKQLVKMLRRRVKASVDPDAQRIDLVRIAGIHQERLGDVEKAIEVWNEIQDAFGSNAETIEALANLSAAARRWTDVVGLLRAAADQATDDPNRRAHQLARMGDVFREQRAAPARAVEAYREALLVEPRHEGARAGLRDLLGSDAAGDAVETLANALRTAGEWQGLLELVERRIELARDDFNRKEVLLEAAAIREQQAGDPHGALGFVRRAFALVWDERIEEELLRLAEQTGDYALASDGYRDAVGACPDAARKRELLFEHGRILETRLSELERALEAFSAITDVDPSDLPAACAVVRVGGNIGNWDAAGRVLVDSARARERLEAELVFSFEAVTQGVAGWDAATAAVDRAVGAVSEIPSRVAHDLLTQLGVWHRDRREDFALAEAALERAVAAHVEPSTLRMLAELQRRAPGRKLVETLLTLAGATGQDLEVLYEAGNIALYAAQDPALARPILEEVLEVASRRWKAAIGIGATEPAEEQRYCSWALEQLVTLRLSGEPAAALELLVDGAKLPFSPDKARRLRFQAAEIAADRLDDSERSVELCSEILDEAPDDAQAIALLALLFSRGGRLSALLELRRRELALGPALERRLELRLDIARVLGELGGDVGERVGALRDNLIDRPGHPPSVDALAEVLSAETRFGELFTTFAQQADKMQELSEPEAAAALLARAGQLAEGPLGDVSRALDAYRRSVELDPTLGALDALARIHTGRNEHAAAVQWLEQRLARTGRTAEDLGAYRDTVLRLARAQQAAGLEQEARRTLVEALRDDPAARKLRTFLAELYRGAEEWSLLGPLLAEGVEYAADDAARVSLLTQAAHVQRRRLGAVAEAVALLERAKALAPEDQGTRLALADALREAGRYEEARGLLETLLSEFGRRRTPERAKVHYHLARIARAQQNLDESLQQLEAASSIERADPKILRLFGDVAREKGQLDQAERAYRALLLIARRQQPADLEETDEDLMAASEVMYDLYRIALDQGQTDRANDLLESAFETAAENNFEALRFERLLRSAGQTELVLRVLDTRLERITDAAATADILVARAQLLADIDRLDEALDTLLEAVGRTPESIALLRSAQELAVRAGAMARYMDRLDEVAAALAADQPKVASNLWLRLGAVAEKDFGDALRAANFYERALGTGRRALFAYQALLRVVPEGDAARRTDALRRFVETPEEEGTDPSLRTQALYRLAAAELAQPESCDAGAVHLEQALDRDPQLDRARQLLSRSVQLSNSTRVVRLYERIARQLGGDRLLLEALTHSAALPDVTPDLVRDAIRLARELGDDERLGRLLERTVELARTSKSALKKAVGSMTELADRRLAAGDVAGAVRLLQEASEVSSEKKAFELQLKVAVLASGQLEDLALAAQTYEKLLEPDPADPRVYRPLVEVYRRMGAHERLSACVERAVSAVRDPAERNVLRMEQGRILLDAGRLEEAEQTLREVLKLDPDHVQASVVLADLFERSGRGDELNRLLERQLDSARDRGDPEAVATIALRMGANVRDHGEGMELYRDALIYAPDHPGLLEALLGLYGSDDDPAERVQVMQKLFALAEGERVAALALELVEWQHTLGDTAAIERTLADAFRRCPHHDALRVRVTEWYTKREDWGRLADVLVVDAQQSQDPAEALGRYREAATLFKDRLGNPARAAEALARARELTPKDISLLEELVDCRMAASQVGDALDVLSTAIDGEDLSDADRVRLLTLRSGLRIQLDPDSLDVLTAAVADLERAASLAGSGFDAELVGALERLRAGAAKAGDDAAEREATMKLARLLPQVGDQRRGLELLVGWVRRMPDDAEAVRRLGEFAAQAEKWAAAAKAYQRLVEITEGQEQVDAAVRLAEACENAGSPLEARPALEQVYARAPNEVVRTRLRRMYEAAGAYEQLATLVMAEAEEATDPATKVERYIDAGDLSLRIPGGEKTAIAAYRQALELAPEDHRVIVKLAELLGNVGEIEHAATLLDSAINSHKQKRSPELSELQHAMARIGRLAEDFEAVFAWLEAAIQTDRQNGAAAAELAVLAMDRGDFETATKALQAITLLKTPGPMGRAEAYLRQGMIAEQRGDRRKAVFLVKRAISTDPDYEDAKKFLEQIGG